MGNIKDNDLAEKELTGQIIDAAIVVHKTLGPGFIESVYEEALCIELNHRDIPFKRQKNVELTYRTEPIGQHRLDLFVADRAVVELKTVKKLDPIHFSIVRSYMKAVDAEAGLILNFAAMPLTIKRVGREFHERQ